MSSELDDRTRVGQRVRDRYRLVRELGSSVFGTVYAAEDESSVQHVAVRFLPRRLAAAPGVVRAVQTGGRSIATASAGHPGLVQVLEIGEVEPGQPIAVMELVEGRRLCDVLAAGRPLDVARARRWVLELAGSVEALHNLGLVHGALRPSNVVVLPDGRIKLMDVEMVGLRDSAASSAPDTSPAEYLAPEQIRRGPITEKTDVYALGAIVYEIFCGAPPFAAATREAVLDRHLTEPPRPMVRRSAPGSIERTVMQAMEKDPERRPWMHEMLNGLWGETTVPTARGRSRTAVVGGAVACAVAIAALAIWGLASQHGAAARSAAPPAATLPATGVNPSAVTSPPAKAPSAPEPAPPRIAAPATVAPERVAPPAATPIASPKAPAEPVTAVPTAAPPAPRVALIPPGGRASVPVLAEMQPLRRTYRIGWLDSGRATTPYQDLVKQALVGYPRDVAFEYRSADGQPARLPELASELVQMKVDIVFAVGGPAIQAARRATSTIPIVMIGSDAARSGESANLTGVTYPSAELARRWIALLKEMGPLSRAAVVYGGDAASRAELASLQATAADAAVKIQIHGVQDGDALAGVFARPPAERPEAIIVPGSPTTLLHLSRIVELAGRARVPAIYGSSEFVEAGGLLAYGPSTPAMYRRAGGYIGKILGPTNPRDLPIEQPSRFELVVNLKTARALGLTLPSSLVLRADRVVQ